ncbi:TPA: hypothetical protein R4L90_000877 [Campylobacter jejuni]|nr:hypothetical protein [Campylobacter jejuni]HED1032110.1 hypothetical protein [Campylobacter jejuni]
MSKKQNKLITKEILNNAIKKGTFLKFDPRLMVKKSCYVYGGSWIDSYFDFKYFSYFI